MLAELIGEVHAASRQTYGARRVHAELVLGRGLTVARCTVELIMARHGLSGLPGRPRFRKIPNVATASDLVERQFGREEAGAVPRKMATPNLLASQIEDITGYRWERDGYDALASDAVGYLTLAGGAGGYYVTENATQPNATSVLVLERLAQAAAYSVAEFDQVNPDSARVFTDIDFSETPDTNRDAMIAQIQALHFRLFGNRVEADGPEVTANLELWQDLHQVEHDTSRAWAGLLSVLLHDPDFLFY